MTAESWQNGGRTGRLAPTIGRRSGRTWADTAPSPRPSRSCLPSFCRASATDVIAVANAAFELAGEPSIAPPSVPLPARRRPPSADRATGGTLPARSHSTSERESRVGPLDFELATWLLLLAVQLPRPVRRLRPLVEHAACAVEGRCCLRQTLSSRSLRRRRPPLRRREPARSCQRSIGFVTSALISRHHDRRRARVARGRRQHADSHPPHVPAAGACAHAMEGRCAHPH